MINTLVPIQKQINAPKDFNYLQPRTNFYPLQEIRKVEEHLFAGFLQKFPNDENEDNLPARVKITDLPISSDIAPGGYKSLLAIRGTLKNLQYA